MGHYIMFFDNSAECEEGYLRLLKHVRLKSLKCTGRVNSGSAGASRQWSPYGDLDGGGRPLAAGLKRPT
jgi:hypothetical protein